MRTVVPNQPVPRLAIGCVCLMCDKSGPKACQETVCVTGGEHHVEPGGCRGCSTLLRYGYFDDRALFLTIHLVANSFTRNNDRRERGVFFVVPSRLHTRMPPPIIRRSNLFGRLKDRITRLVEEHYSHAVLGYSLRVVAVTGVCSAALISVHGMLAGGQEAKPISKRWVPYYTPLRFVERRQEPGTMVFIYRFALPNPWDYTGHDVISSVELDFRDHWLFSSRRWYTPISHPEQRGFVEFAMKEHIPGCMSWQLKEMKPGDIVYMSRWLKEFHYSPNEFDEIGFIAANSGVTPALQMLNVALADNLDKTKFSLLVLALKPSELPFRKKLLDLQARFPNRLKVSFASKTGNTEPMMMVPAPKSTEFHQAHLNPAKVPLEPRQVPVIRPKVTLPPVESQLVGGAAADLTSVSSFNTPYYDFLGSVDRDMILETMPHPRTPRTKIMMCGPNSLTSFLTGRTLPLWRHTYWQGWYHGVLKEMGYRRGDVYKFGSTTQLMGFAH